MQPLNLFFFLKLCILDFFRQLPILKKVEKNQKRSGQLQHPSEEHSMRLVLSDVESRF